LGLLEREISKRNCNGIVGGYFNTVENPSYKCFARENMLSRGEIMVWEALKITLNVEKPFQSDSSFKFLWDNQRIGSSHSLI
jgi:hypothetical protein